MRRALRRRVGQAPDEDAGRRRPQRPVDAQLRQQGGQAQLRERPQADLLHPDAAGANQAQRADVDRLDVGRSGIRHTGVCAAGDQLRGNPLRFPVHGRWAIGHQRHLAGQDVDDAGAQPGPVGRRDVEVPAEVEEGALAHGAAEAFGLHQAVGEVGDAVPGPPGPGAPDEHGASIAGRSVWRNACLTIMALHSASQNTVPLESTSYGPAPTRIPPISTLMSAILVNLG